MEAVNSFLYLTAITKTADHHLFRQPGLPRFAAIVENVGPSPQERWRRPMPYIGGKLSFERFVKERFNLRVNRMNAFSALTPKPSIDKGG